MMDMDHDQHGTGTGTGTGQGSVAPVGGRESSRLVPALCLALAASAVLWGCKGNSKSASAGTPSNAQTSAGSGATVPAGDDPATLYAKGRYASAFEAAKVRASRATGDEKERLSLIAGMSAAAMDRNSDALAWLRPLTSSQDRQIAGRAAAGVGLVEAVEGRHASAVPYLTSAADRLSGDESAKARFYLGESYSAMGRSADATAAYRAAASSASDSRLKRLAQERLSLTAFTIQIGSYRENAKARDAARSAASRTAAAGLPAPRVVSKQLPDGRSVYAVQVGVYREMGKAQADRARLGGDAVVARTAGG